MDRPKLRDYLLNEDGSVKHYDFKDKKDFGLEPKAITVQPGKSMHTILRGVMHDGVTEQAVASDGYSLILTRRWYKDEYAGKSICVVTDKKDPKFTEGHEIDGRWPNYAALLREPEGVRFESSFPWETVKHICIGLRAYVKDLHAFLKEKGQKYTKQEVARMVAIRVVRDPASDKQVWLSAEMLDRLIRIAGLIGAGDSIYIQGANMAMVREKDVPEGLFEDEGLVMGMMVNSDSDPYIKNNYTDDLIIEIVNAETLESIEGLEGIGEPVRLNFSDFDELG